MAVDLSSLKATEEISWMFKICCEDPFAKADVIKYCGSNSRPLKTTPHPNRAQSLLLCLFLLAA